MIGFDASAVMLGLAVGLVTSGIYFTGLAAGMWLALHSASPVIVLSLSAALRIAALLGLGWIVLGQCGAWAALGYAAAFLVGRFMVTMLARTCPAGDTP